MPPLPLSLTFICPEDSVLHVVQAVHVAADVVAVNGPESGDLKLLLLMVQVQWYNIGVLLGKCTTKIK